MNPTKFRSPHLNTPNSRYDFYNFAIKSGKTNKEKSNFKSGQQLGALGPVHLVVLTVGGHGQHDPM